MLQSATAYQAFFWNDAMIEDFEDVFSANSHQFFIGTEDGFALLNTSKQETVKDKLSLLSGNIYDQWQRLHCLFQQAYS